MKRFCIFGLLILSCDTVGVLWAGDVHAEKNRTASPVNASSANKTDSIGPPEDLRLEPWWREKGDCGPLALLVLMQLQNKQVRLDDIKKIVHVDPDQGCSLKDLQGAAEQLGLATEARYVEPRDLRSVSGPFIVHGVWSVEKNRGHFFLLLGYDSSTKKYSTIDTVSTRLGWLPEDRVLRGYSGYVLVPKEPVSQKWSRWTGYGLLCIGMVILLFWSFALYRRRQHNET
ncbi:MAG: cysteine peptidase family C39 domain-containing protein [Thermoguttaceae bacterium]